MINSHLFIKKLVLMSVGVMLMTILVTTAHADDRVVRNHSFDMDGIEEVEFSNSVGAIDIVQGNGKEMRVVLEIEADKKGFFHRRVDVDDMDLEMRKRGDTLFLNFREDDVKAQWTVEMPAVRRTILEVGVGEIRLELGDTDLDVELGVGEVNVLAPEKSVGRINLHVGVGDASVRGAEILDSESAFISQSIRAQGKGDNDLEVDVGVGDVSVRLK